MTKNNSTFIKRVGLHPLVHEDIIKYCDLTGKRIGFIVNDSLQEFFKKKENVNLSFIDQPEKNRVSVAVKNELHEMMVQYSGDSGDSMVSILDSAVHDYLGIKNNG